MTRELFLEIVICTYNNAPLLDRSLDAISRQRVPPDVEWGVLVVDNNCTDGTVAVVQKHVASRKLRLRMVSEPKQGLTPARLCGVRNTSSDWIAFVDDDCLLEEDWLEQAVAFARTHPDCGAFGGEVTLVWEREPPDYTLRYTYSFASQEHGPEPKRVGCLVGAGLVARRAALEECGWVDNQFLEDRIGEKLISGGDVEMALRLAAIHPLWYTPSCRLRHVIPESRISAKYLKEVNYGLGTSKLLGDSMLWHRSYARWLLTSLYKSKEYARALPGDTYSVLRGTREVTDLLIQLSFLRGWMAGIWRLLRMDRRERQALLGCARIESPHG